MGQDGEWVIDTLLLILCIKRHRVKVENTSLLMVYLISVYAKLTFPLVSSFTLIRQCFYLFLILSGVPTGSNTSPPPPRITWLSHLKIPWYHLRRSVHRERDERMKRGKTSTSFLVSTYRTLTLSFIQFFILLIVIGLPVPPQIFNREIMSYGKVLLVNSSHHQFSLSYISVR